MLRPFAHSSDSAWEPAKRTCNRDRPWRGPCATARGHLAGFPVSRSSTANTVHDPMAKLWEPIQPCARGFDGNGWMKVSQCPLSGSSAAEQTVWNRPAASISRPTTSFEGYRVERKRTFPAKPLRGVQLRLAFFSTLPRDLLSASEGLMSGVILVCFDLWGSASTLAGPKAS